MELSSNKNGGISEFKEAH